jgi:hypothetical protein
VAEVDDVAQLGHHRRVHHADGEAQSGVRRDEAGERGRVRDLWQRR